MSGATEHENFASVEEIYQGLLARAPEHRMAPRLDAMQLAVSALGDPHRSATRRLRKRCGGSARSWR